MYATFKFLKDWLQNNQAKRTRGYVLVIFAPYIASILNHVNVMTDEHYVLALFPCTQQYEP